MCQIPAEHTNPSVRLRIFGSDVRNGGLDANREIPRVLSLVGLDVEEKKSVNSFSLGMKRRLDIATALLGDTDVLIFDEPWQRIGPAGASRVYGPLSVD